MPTAQEHLAHKAANVPPGSLRHTLLLAARRFKASWVELGKLLVEVHHKGLYQEWGYPNFETYCLAELRIRKQTAEKLLKSFGFLERHEPERVKAPDFTESAPAFEVVEVLAQAEERGQLSAAEYRSVRDSIWEQDRSTAELKRELSEKFPAPERAQSANAELKHLLTLAKRLAAELHGAKKIPKAVAERADALVSDLEEVVSQRADA
jgi:hypothetical protein